MYTSPELNAQILAWFEEQCDITGDPQHFMFYKDILKRIRLHPEFTFLNNSPAYAVSRKLYKILEIRYSTKITRAERKIKTNKKTVYASGITGIKWRSA
jgi:hypothetical protein